MAYTEEELKKELETKEYEYGFSAFKQIPNSDKILSVVIKVDDRFKYCLDVTTQYVLENGDNIVSEKFVRSRENFIHGDFNWDKLISEELLHKTWNKLVKPWIEYFIDVY